MRRPVQITLIAICFLIGIVYSVHYLTNPTGLLILGLVSLGLGWGLLQSKYGYVVFAIGGLYIGIAVGTSYFNTHNSFNYNQLIGQKVSMSATVASSPYWDDKGNNVFNIGSAEINGKHYDGLIRVKTLTGTAKQGNNITVEGKLWPTLGNTEVGVSFAKVTVTNSAQPGHIIAKEWFLKQLGLILPRPSSDFMAGVLIGERSSLPKALQDMLILLGLSHIVAVSGYNLSILAGLLDKVLSHRWRWGGLALSLWVVWGFTLLAGAGASILRAAIMASIFLILRYYDRDRAILPALGICAVIMVAFNPTYLISDLSWQLSFLSLVGIVVLTPRLQVLLPRKPKVVMELLAVTLAAQIATLGLVVYKFERLSVIAPLANLIVMPLIPTLMILGMLLPLLFLLMPQAAIGLGQLLHWCINKLFELLSYLASWSVAQVSIAQPELWQIVLYYAALMLWVLLTSRNPKLKAFQSDLENAIISPIKAKSHQDFLEGNIS